MHAPGGATVVDDTYNASPETVVSLIATLATMEGRERVLVLGHLAELEEGLADTAETIGRALRPPLDACFVYAPASPGLFERLAALAEGCEVRNFQGQQELIAALRGLDAARRVIGVKGARSAHLERIVQGMMGAKIACGLETCGLLQSCTDCDRMTTRTV
jgi:UDP-N-acetylmuramoyl-tripeptide--D-alanyl-D-alanine ligase